MSRTAYLGRFRARSSRIARTWILVEGLESRQLMTTTVALGTAQYAGLVAVQAASTAPPSSALSPSQIEAAYGINKISFSGGTVAGTGAGQTIAIVDFGGDSTIASDLAAFDKQYGIASASLSVVNQAGGGTLPANDSGAALETSLDVEWAHAAAPAARIVVVEAASANTGDLLAAVNAAKAVAGVTVISMSWGTSEFQGETAYDSTFTTPTGHTGITFIASAGDSGAGAEWPASSINVVSVGGTTLSLTSSGAIASQSAWADSGGGASALEPEPSYQESVQSTGRRESPDVSLDADPNTGVSVYSVAGGGWLQVGGTSLGAPVWAGLIAIADEGRVLDGKTTLDGPTQTLADLYAAPSGSYSDVTGGSRATAGYDTVTGLGTPNATTLVAALVADPVFGTTTTTTTTGTGTGTGTTAGGGGGTTSNPPTNNPRRPGGGRRGGFGGLFAFAGSGSDHSFNPPSTPKNSGQTASQSSTPHDSTSSGSAWTITYPSRSTFGSATQRSVSVVAGHWGREGRA